MSAFTDEASNNYDPLKSIQIYDALAGKTELSSTSATSIPPEERSPADLLSAYNDGETITVTQALKDAYPNSPSLQNAPVGGALKKLQGN